jgi:hypothetical protein
MKETRNFQPIKGMQMPDITTVFLSTRVLVFRRIRLGLLRTTNCQPIKGMQAVSTVTEYACKGVTVLRWI